MTTNPFTCLMELKDWSIDLQQQAWLLSQLSAEWRKQMTQRLLACLAPFAHRRDTPLVPHRMTFLHLPRRLLAACLATATRSSCITWLGASRLSPGSTLLNSWCNASLLHGLRQQPAPQPPRRCALNLCDAALLLPHGGLRERGELCCHEGIITNKVRNCGWVRTRISRHRRMKDKTSGASL
jgi:hypothetical protein